MRYCRYRGRDGVGRYARLGERDGALWALEQMEAPEEDLRSRAAGAETFTAKPLSEMNLLAPVVPSKIVCVGRNYKDHAAELGNDVPKEPLLFLKAPSALLEPGGVVRLPVQSQRVDYEGELGVVIGRRCFQIGPEEDVREYIRGYVCVNDVTARDLQKADGQWSRAKGFDTFCPVGPFVSDEIDPAAGEPVLVTTRVNGETKQTGSTRDLIFPIADLLRYITAAMTLEPGDLIPTGTPAGVAAVKAGDRMEVEVDGLGVLVSMVR